MKWINARKVNDWVLLTDCVHGATYRLASRNLLIGVFSSSQQGFVGIRTKFSDKFLDVESHWDADEHGTAKPIELIEMCPLDVGQWNGNHAMMVWLEKRLTE